MWSTESVADEHPRVGHKHPDPMATGVWAPSRSGTRLAQFATQGEKRYWVSSGLADTSTYDADE